LKPKGRIEGFEIIRALLAIAGLLLATTSVLASGSAS